MRKPQDKAPAPFFNIGASSLLVIFLILCLVTFAILTLSSARSDQNFANQLADRKTAYYTACNTAETELAQIDAILASAWQIGAPDWSAVEKQLTASDDPDALPLTVDFSGETPSIAFTVAIDDRQNLCVTLILATAPQKGDAYYRISQWQVQASGEWNGDQTLNLMK